MAQNHKRRNHPQKIRFYGERLAPIDVFSNLNSEYILRTNQQKNNFSNKSPSNLKKKKNRFEDIEKPAPRALSFLEQRDLLIEEFLLALKTHSKDIYDICESLVLSASAFTSLAFVISEKPETQFSKETFVGIVADELHLENSDFLRQLFDDLDVERSGYINIHQLLALINFSRLHRGSTIDDIIRAIFEGVIWEAALLEHNSTPRPNKGRRNTNGTTYIGPRSLISFDIYKKHSKKKELPEAVFRLPLPFPSIVTAIRTVCPKGVHRGNKPRPNTSSVEFHSSLVIPPVNDEPDSIDSFLCRLYECAMKASQQRHHSFRRLESFKIFENSSSSSPNGTFPLNLSPRKKNSPQIRFAEDTNNDDNPQILRQISRGYDDMITSPFYQSMKVTLDDIGVFVSTQPEIQSRLRAELIDQIGRHDHNVAPRRVRPIHGNPH